LLYVYTADGHLVRWNKKHEEITGYSAEELTGKYILDWFAGEAEDIAIITAGMKKALSEGYAEVEAHLITKSGTVILFSFTAVRMIVNEQSYFVGIGIDITERKRAEQALREREALLRAVVDNAPFEFWARDIDGRCIMVNKVLIDHWGNMLGQRPEDSCLLPEDLKTWQENNRRAFAGELVQVEAYQWSNRHCLTKILSRNHLMNARL
jgi:PAS domain S-box-containing protein